MPSTSFSLSAKVFALALSLGWSTVACSKANVQQAATSLPASADAIPSDLLLNEQPNTSLFDEENDRGEGELDITTDPGPGSSDEPTPEVAHAALRGDYTVTVIATIPHDTEAFTQGLELVNGRLLESQGLHGSSARTLINPATGAIEHQVQVQDETIFAEGITVVEDHFVQLSWTSGIALTGDNQTLEANGQSWFYEGEGWGLCFDGDRLVRSDGTSRLTFHDPETFEPLGSITVRGNDGSEIDQINELECVGSQILANVWGWDHLLAIDAKTGALDALIDATSLRPNDTPFELNYALNGIAYDKSANRYYLTGKRWPVIYLVEFEPAE